MSVMIYMSVEVEGEQVKPIVHVSSFQRMPWQNEGAALGEIPLEDVRFGIEVAGEVLSFAERLRAESSP